MIRFLFTSLVVILANTVLAQAGYLEANPVKRLELNSWKAVYAGNTQMDGMEVVAVLEKTESTLTLPSPIVANLQTLVPLQPMVQKNFRLSLVAQDQPNIKVSFPLQARTITMDGRPTLAYFSTPRLGDQFEFALISRPDNTLQVQYRRAAGENTETGEFSLSQIPQLFGK